MELLHKALHDLNEQGYEFAVSLKEPGTSRSSSPYFSKLYISKTFERNAIYNSLRDLSQTSVVISKTKPCTKKLEDEFPSLVLKLDDRRAVEEYLNAGFKLLRQLPCKSIAKAWIKVIEPRKKTRYPYIGGEKTKPIWWPHDVMHREPDHLQKPERLKLMTTIISEVVPLMKNPRIFKDLKSSTMDNSLFRDDPSKKLVLESIYKLSWELCLGINSSIRIINLNKITKFKRLNCYLEREKPILENQEFLDWELYNNSEQHAEPNSEENDPSMESSFLSSEKSNTAMCQSYSENSSDEKGYSIEPPLQWDHERSSQRYKGGSEIPHFVDLLIFPDSDSEQYSMNLKVGTDLTQLSDSGSSSNSRGVV